MAFTLDPSADITEEYRRVVGEQFTGALTGLASATPESMAAAVHDARKRCKRLRAIFRLVRPALGDRHYRSLDTGVRDAARELSTTRDAAALVDMFDALLAAHGVDPAEESMRMGRLGFETRLAAVEADQADANPLRRAQERLEVAAGLAQRAGLNGSGFSALAGGLTHTYHQGAAALAHLRRSGSIEDSHDWRKAVKYTWHHLELLESTAPSVLVPAARAFHQAADALGDAHNLAVLVGTLESAPAEFGGQEAARQLVKLAERSRADLEDRAISLGVRLYAEAPKAFAARLRAYWKAAGKVGPERPAGELADVASAPDPAPPADGEARSLSLIR